MNRMSECYKMRQRSRECSNQKCEVTDDDVVVIFIVSSIINQKQNIRKQTNISDEDLNQSAFQRPTNT